MLKYNTTGKSFVFAKFHVKSMQQVFVHYVLYYILYTGWPAVLEFLEFLEVDLEKSMK